MRSRIRTIALLLGLFGCGGSGNSLSGSIATTHGLSFDTVTLRQLDTAYVVAYLRTAKMETVARVVYDPRGMSVPIGQQLQLDFGQNGKPGNAAVSRATADGLTFPPAQSGTFVFDNDPLGSGDVSGHFGVLFSGGQTLGGAFSAPLVREKP